jgi:nucleotide-binding universal stress UspA family protein
MRFTGGVRAAALQEGMMFQHLMVPIDDSDRSQRAVDTAIGLASRLGAALTAFIAEPPAPPPQAGHSAVGYVRRMEAHDRNTAAHAERLLAAVKARAAEAGVACEACYARSSQIVPAILEAARERGCDLIVMATHVHGAFTDWLSPSYTRGVMARGNLPLLVVH